MTDEQRIISVEHQLSSHDQRIQALEAWQQDQRTNTAVRAEREKHLDRRFDKLENAVDEVKGYLLKIVWVIVIGILGAFVTFLINGGMSVVP